MRLTCPNCSAQYEVPDEVIPEEGRDVQCSNCEKTWFQAKHSQAAAPEPEPSIAPEPEPEPAPAPIPAPKPPAPQPAPPPQPASTGNIDPDIVGILQEEAAREADLRAQESVGLETQTDLALDAPPEPAPARKTERPPATKTSTDAGQRDALPDVDAINSSLRDSDTKPKLEEVQPVPRKQGGGFMRGFVLMLVVGLVLLLIYSNAQQISQAVPQADPALQSYVSLIDKARIWLESQAGAGAQ